MLCQRVWTVLVVWMMGASSWVAGFLSHSATPALTNTRRIIRQNALQRVVVVVVDVKMNAKETEEVETTTTTVYEDDQPPPLAATTTTTTESSKAASNKAPPILARIFGAVTTVWGYGIVAWGALLTCGLILNLLGYGYTFRGGELRIDTLAQMRTEIRMEQELGGRPSQRQQQQVNGATEFFLKNPFTSASILTGAVLAYEALLKKEQQ